MTLASELIASVLEQCGITHAFGIIGGGNVALWDAIHKRGATQLICCHHEQAAVMAATYYWRTCGKLALALVTTGAGSANAVTGVVAAHMDSIPVLVISGNEASRHMNAPTRVWGVQGYDSVAMVRGVTKLSHRVTKEDAYGVGLMGLLNCAVESAVRPRSGPVWIDIPKDIQASKVVADNPEIINSAPLGYSVGDVVEDVDGTMLECVK